MARRRWFILICMFAMLLLITAASAESTVTLPENVTVIEAEAFRGLTEAAYFDLPAGVTEIGDGAFRDSGLPSAALRYYFAPAGISVGPGAFDNCRAVIRLNGTELTGLTYAVDNDGVTITGMSGQPVEVVIPDTIGGLPVVAIGNGVFSGKSDLTRVVIPATVTSIGNDAFRNCSALTGIDLPAGLASLGSSVFMNCRALTEVTIPESITILPESAFEGATGLQQVHLPDTLTAINNYVFYGCRALTEISIPAGVTAIPKGCFQGCTVLQSVQLPSGMESIGQNAFRSCTALAGINFPAGLISIGQEAFRDSCVGQSANAIYALPATVETFGTNAFYNCGAGLLVEKNSDLEAFVKTNGYTFAYDADNGFRYQYKKVSGIDTLYLTGYEGAGGNVTIPAGPAVIGENAFKDNTDITAVTIPEGVTLIDRWAFQSCANLMRLTMSDTVTTVMNNAFRYDAKLTDVTFSANLTAVKGDAFSDTCTVEGTYLYNLPDGLTECDGYSFRNSGAALCVSRDSATEALVRAAQYTYTHYGETDFRYRWYSGEGERLKLYLGTTSSEVQIPAGIWLIDDSAFKEHVEIQSVVIPEGVTKIGHDVFRDCVSLIDVTFPRSLVTIETGAFAGCGNEAEQTRFVFALPDGLTGVYGRGTNAAFYNCPAILTCGIDSTTAATLSDQYYSYARNDRPNELDFRYRFGISGNVRVPKLYDYVGTETQVRLPDDCEYADREIFKDRTDLTLICAQLSATDAALSAAELNHTFPGHEDFLYRVIDDVLYVMDWTGSGTEINIPAAEDYIEANWDEQIISGAFLNETAVTKVVIPEGVTRINAEAFSGCENLTDITLPDSLRSMDQKVFRYCGQNAASDFYVFLPDNIDSIVGDGGGANTFERFYDYHSMASAGDQNHATLVCKKQSVTAYTLSDGNYSFALQGHHDDGLIYRYENLAIDGENGGQPMYRLFVYDYVGDATEVTIPDDIGVYGVARTPPGGSDTWHPAFMNVKTLRKIVIPEGVVVISQSAFANCTALTDITLPSTLKRIRERAFENVGHTGQRFIVVIPAGVEVLYAGGFKSFGDSGATLVALGSYVRQVLYDNLWQYYESVEAAEAQYPLIRKDQDVPDPTWFGCP